MQHPSKPKKPRKPGKPREYTIDIRRRTYFSQRKIQNLAELNQYLVEKYAKKEKLIVEDVELEDVFIGYVDGSIFSGDKVKDANFDKKNKKYLNRLQAYEDKLKQYEDDLKRYEIQLELYNAWLVKEREDKIKNRMKKLELELEEVKKEKEALLEKA